MVPAKFLLGLTVARDVCGLLGQVRDPPVCGCCAKTLLTACIDSIGAVLITCNLCGFMTSRNSVVHIRFQASGSNVRPKFPGSLHCTGRYMHTSICYHVESLGQVFLVCASLRNFNRDDACMYKDMAAFEVNCYGDCYAKWAGRAGSFALGRLNYWNCHFPCFGHSANAEF